MPKAKKTFAITPPDEHVYCTNCEHFAVTTVDENGVPSCINADICDMCDFEDSKPYRERPMYKPLSTIAFQDDDDCIDILMSDLMSSGCIENIADQKRKK